MPKSLTTEEKIEWMINMLRASISHDLAKLATELLTTDQQRTITQRLTASTKALRDLKKTLDEPEV